jgi:hypothetical protein
LSEHLLETLFVPTALRVARRLLILDDEFDGQAIPLTQEDLADGRYYTGDGQRGATGISAD